MPQIGALLFLKGVINEKEKTVKCTLFAILSIILIIIGVEMLNPLRRSNEKIREQLLELTPVGTDIKDVTEYIESNDKWKIRYTSDDGYNLFQGRPTEVDSTTKVGEKSIRVYLGEYRNPLAVDVSAFYGFDGDGNLIDVHILKIVDGL